MANDLHFKGLPPEVTAPSSLESQTFGGKCLRLIAMTAAFTLIPLPAGPPPTVIKDAEGKIYNPARLSKPVELQSLVGHVIILEGATVKWEATKEARGIGAIDKYTGKSAVWGRFDRHQYTITDRDAAKFEAIIDNPERLLDGVYDIVATVCKLREKNSLTDTNPAYGLCDVKVVSKSS